MAYTKNKWVNGDTITADKLNHMEEGIASASKGSGGGGGGTGDSPFFVVVFHQNELYEIVCSTTHAEIYANCVNGGKIPVGVYATDYSYLFASSFDRVYSELYPLESFSFYINAPMGDNARITINADDSLEVVPVPNPDGIIYLNFDEGEPIAIGSKLMLSYSEATDIGNNLLVLNLPDGAGYAYFMARHEDNCSMTFVCVEDTTMIFEVQAPYDESVGDYDWEAPMIIADIRVPSDSDPQ